MKIVDGSDNGRDVMADASRKQLIFINNVRRLRRWRSRLEQESSRAREPLDRHVILRVADGSDNERMS